LQELVLRSALELELLLAGRLSGEQRKAAGFALALVGGLTTIPLAMNILRNERGTVPALRSVA